MVYIFMGNVGFCLVPKPYSSVLLLLSGVIVAHVPVTADQWPLAVDHHCGAEPLSDNLVSLLCNLLP